MSSSTAMRGVILKRWWPAIDPLPPDSFARLHWGVSLLPAAGDCIDHPDSCGDHEFGGLDYGSLVAVAPFHWPETREF
jgi:hypothetical protein